MSSIEQRYQSAKAQYAEIGVDTDAVIAAMGHLPISLHCWQGDDVRGFESPEREIGNGLAVTGTFPGRARNADELRADLEVAMSLIPGPHRVNLHACYGEHDGATADRDELTIEQFAGWLQWAAERGWGLDFNPTFFSHLKAEDGFTLSHQDVGIRDFWIQHAIRCREIGEAFGRELGTACVTNIWIPDGYKDTPIDRLSPRARLRDSLGQILARPIDPRYHRDSVESKLFGIGSESYVVGSHEFYLALALEKGLMLCLDAGHFHPTETIADKISTVMLWLDEMLLHVSRGVRWDSDHVVTLNDETRSIAQELVRGGFLQRVRIGLDFFDASINRVAAWVIGTRSTQKALLEAMLEPLDALQAAEQQGDFTRRLALLEELKTMPAGAIWDYYCLQDNVPVGTEWLKVTESYEREVLSRRKYVDVF